MKTIQELYSEVLKSEELKKAFSEAVQNKTVEDFLKAQGCEASMEDVAAFLKEQQAKTGELTDNELDNVAGGCNGTEAEVSILTVGIGCAMTAIQSAIGDDMKGTYGTILCGNEDMIIFPGNHSHGQTGSFLEGEAGENVMAALRAADERRRNK